MKKHVKPNISLLQEDIEDKKRVPSHFLYVAAKSRHLDLDQLMKDQFILATDLSITKSINQSK